MLIKNIVYNNITKQNEYEIKVIDFKNSIEYILFDIEQQTSVMSIKDEGNGIIISPNIGKYVEYHVAMYLFILMTYYNHHHLIQNKHNIHQLYDGEIQKNQTLNSIKL